MSTTASKNGFEIKESYLPTPREQAAKYLKAVSYKPTSLAKEESGTAQVLNLWADIKNNSATPISINLAKDLLILGQRLLSNTVMQPEKANAISVAIQEGLTIALYVKNSYEQTVNLIGLQQKVQANSKLTADESKEFSEKLQTSASITLFVWASYVTYTLSSKQHSAFNKFQGIPEVYLLDPIKSIGSVIYYFDKYITTEEMVSNEQDLLDMTIEYFQFVADYVAQRSSGLKYAEMYTGVSYKLEKSDFSVTGFEKVQANNVSSIEFNRTEFEEIVGNREAKHLARRIVAAILSYCFKTKRNPYDAIAKYARLIMGYGKPGTGKSLLIAAIATELKERCDWLGYPFLFLPFPDNIVSTYQGGSADRALDWFKPQSDPTKIIYAPIDDAENNLMDRSRDGVSAGVKEVIGVFLRMTEGAYSTSYGNSLIGIYTNLPEQIDKAVLSRIQKRAPIDGAVTHNDFLDQNYLWMKKHMQNLPEIVKMDPIDYVFMSDQAKIVNIAALQQDADSIITHPVLRRVYNTVSKQYKKTSPNFYAAILYQMQKECGLLTSREARNIQTNVDTRMVDFDLPEDFWNKEEMYFLKSYDEKVVILKELMKDYMGGQSYADIMLQETLKYLDTFISINLSEDDKRVQKIADDRILLYKGDELFKVKLKAVQAAILAGEAA